MRSTCFKLLPAILIFLIITSSMAIGRSSNGSTATPIQHLVVIFQENVSFDHYFATYPRALNPAGEPSFVGKPGTPTVNGLSGRLLWANPNAANPYRLSRAQAATCDQDHDYTPEQLAMHSGLMDKFLENTGTGTGCDAKQVMAYFDGNTVTALWNYAQHFSMNDNFFNTTFGPSTPGALNLISGQTHGAISGGTGDLTGEVIEDTVIGDPQPASDICSYRDTVEMTGTNVGDLLNAKGVTWGWFEGGFDDCNAHHRGSNGEPKKDYIPHHEPFQYYASTRNPHHLPPSSVSRIGETDQANHQYGLSEFWAAVGVHHLPAVSFLKASGYQDGHAGYSDPLAEQTFLVNTINELQKLPEWSSMAILITYDDSDGWYDHVMPPIVSPSDTSADALIAPGNSGKPRNGAFEGRAGLGPRLPFLLISPFAKPNFVDNTLTDQSSILRYIEDNWGLGRIGDQSFDSRAGSLMNMFNFTQRQQSPLFLNPGTGEPL